MNLATTSINHTNEFSPYMVNRDEAAGLRDIYSMYVPRGAIRKYVTYPRAGGGMPLYVGHSEYYDFDHVIRHIVGRPSLDTRYKGQMFGGGKGHNLPNMAISGVAETFERSISAFGYFSRKPGELMVGSIKSLTGSGRDFLDPSRLRIFASEQFKDPTLVAARYVPFTENSRMTWVEGKRLLSGEKIMVPAQIGLPFFLPHKEEELVGYFTTGGLAAHINYQEAIYHGVLELFERDAVNLRWNCRLAPNQIVLDGNYSNLKLARLLKIADSLPVDLKFYIHRNGFDELSVVSTLGYVPGFKKYGYAAGGGVSFDIEETMLSALSEFGQSEGTLRFLLLAKDWELAQATRRIFHVEEGVKITEIDHFFKVLTYYGYASNFAKLGWYMNDGDPVSIDAFPRQRDGSLPARYASMLSLLRKYRIDPIIIDLSPPQMTQMRLVKVVIPDLAPPYVQNLPMLGSERYYEGPRSIGMADRRFEYSDLFTADPQPYP